MVRMVKYQMCKVLTMIVIVSSFVCQSAISKCQSLNTTNSSICDVCQSGYMRTTSMMSCRQQITNCKFIKDYITYDFFNIPFSQESTSGTDLYLGDDGCQYNVPIGFTFKYWGISQTIVNIHANGYIYLGSPYGIIYANYMNLIQIDPSDYIRYQTIGSAPNRKFIVSYHVSYYSCQTVVTDFQIVLFQTSNVIRINVKSHPGCIISPYSSQGISNQGLSKYVYQPNRWNTNWAGTQNSSVQFQPINSQCDTCQTGFQRTTSLTQCGALIPNCEFLNDQSTSQCDTCQTGFQRTTSLTQCGALIPNCEFLNDQSTSQCDTCQTGFQRTTSLLFCGKQIELCQFLNDGNPLQCDKCVLGFVWKKDTQQCFPSHFDGCSFYLKENGKFRCKFCNRVQDLVLISETQGCRCKDGYFKDKDLNKCRQICGDGIKIQYQCDDNNTLDNDGCNSQCKLQTGFICNTSLSPTYCNSTQQLIYQILSIQKTDNGQNSAIIILKPKNKNMPFNVIKNNLFTKQQQLTQLNMQIIVQSFPNQIVVNVQFQLIKVDNNQIHLLFYYNFTVQGLTAKIHLNYSQTRYLNKTQNLQFTLKGKNQALSYTQLQEAYNNVSKNFIITNALVMLGLLIGLVLPKFIGLETLITLQLIFFSQLLISDFELWPVGFSQFSNLKIATGYNQFISITQYVPLNDISKKYNKLELSKTIIQNFNMSFIILLIPSVLLNVSTFIRQNKQTQIKKLKHQNKAKNLHQDGQILSMQRNWNKINTINQILYWISSQLTFWCILPLISTLGAQFMISNKETIIIQSDFTPFLLNFRVTQLLFALFIVISIGLNHFKNSFLSIRTNKKIQERPQQLLYKKLLFLYLFVMGLLIFLLNDKKIYKIPISVVCLIIHVIYMVALFKINPYKQSLRVHTITLCINQVLYLVFLTLLNLINLIDQINDFIILCLGYFILGCCYLLILLTIIRLYYQIRYGEALQKRIKEQKQQQEKKKKQIESNKLQSRLKNQAKKKLDQAQKQRDFNQYLIQTQRKQYQQIELLQWLSRKNWQNQTKQKYYYERYDKKPQSWQKKNNKKSNTKQNEQRKALLQKQKEKKKKKQQDPQYINVMNRLKKSFQENKKKQYFKEQKVKKMNKDKNFEGQI